MNTTTLEVSGVSRCNVRIFRPGDRRNHHVDRFDLTPTQLDPIDATYDRAALVALPVPLRDQYSTHLKHLTANASQLLITFEYDQSLADGPPFSIPEEEVKRHYANNYNITHLATKPISNGLKGKHPASESVWLLNEPVKS